MAVKIKLKRLGKIHAPYYRVVVADARAKRDGRAIEEIGKYHPKQEPSLIEINSERVQYWLSVGAQPTDPVRNLLNKTGDWQRFRGEDGAEGVLKSAAPRPDKKEAFAAALKETHGETDAAATTAKARGRKTDAKAEKPDTRSAKGRSSRADTAHKAGVAHKADAAAAGGAQQAHTEPEGAEHAQAAERGQAGAATAATGAQEASPTKQRRSAARQAKGGDGPSNGKPGKSGDKPGRGGDQAGNATGGRPPKGGSDTKPSAAKKGGKASSARDKAIAENSGSGVSGA